MLVLALSKRYNIVNRISSTKNFCKQTASELAAINGHFAFSTLMNEANCISKQENQIPPDSHVARNNNLFTCKRSRDSLASVGALDGDLSDKRLRFSGKCYILFSKSLCAYLNKVRSSSKCRRNSGMSTL